ncbi:MAG: sensor histidine kinase [Streptosporangiaceae bacterium]
MAGRPGELLAALLRAEPRRTPSGWALAMDAAIGVGAAAFAVVEVAGARPLGPVALTVAALTGLPLAARRLCPTWAFLAIVTAIFWIKFNETDQPVKRPLGPHVFLVIHEIPMPAIAFGTAVFAAYSAVAHSRHRYVAIGVVAVVTLSVTATFGSTLPQFPDQLTALLAITPAVAAALGIRTLRRRLSDSADRLRRATEEHEAATLRAIEAERARIAGELHDVVTHNVSVMVVQAGAARMAVASSPDEATGALHAIEASGRTAMAELRNLLGLLSPAGDDVALRPQPGLGELDELISRVSAAGLSVDLLVQGTPRQLPPGADLAAYRVVQEALTNVLRHAGRAATSVMVHWGELLVITVSDAGCGPSFPWEGAARGSVGSSPGLNTEPGRGLIGLRQRLSLYGGELDAGPRPGGGWQVRAVMPVGLAA